MKILALDSSGLVAGVAVVQDDILQASYTIHHKKTHSQTLLPMLEEVCKMIELDMETIDAIAVAAGPGSFTGLRIGSATAKGLGLALNKPIVEIGTVEAIAYQLYGVEKVICPMLDARRNQVYTGLYTFETVEGKSVFKTLAGQCAVSVEEIIEKVNKMKKEVVFLGDGVPVYEEIISERTEVPYEFAPAFCNRQNAGALGSLACTYFKERRFVDPREHKPEYLRMSQAERERLEKEEKKQ
ncbi:MAG: tRNA (adenosine(37)-N6)-threonylcarbamoyltransferase complex dimerization subunit type 1 TsaB [Lachnospiraceae bacterium]|nr:tRNA (adenosine(37)-N6)-threonylcarbamoyltransferase complex dimerization subunit type 1 TsaB [Lachnospiraceae bacterium]